MLSPGKGGSAPVYGHALGHAAIVEPDGVADDIWWESVAFVGVHGPSLAISAR